jgi:myo-inositol-1(or 4)-monophosphatase
VFGVVYSADDDAVFWGGPGIGAFRGDEPITVSQLSDRARASVCTGVPARVDVSDPVYKKRFWDVISGFGKIRMLGSASMSLVYVASGVADAYCEDGIMIWDVAAGLAIVQGAGGSQTNAPGRDEFSVNVFACNGRLTHPANVGPGANEQ